MIHYAELPATKPASAKLARLQDLYECLHKIKKLKVRGVRRCSIVHFAFFSTGLCYLCSYTFLLLSVCFSLSLCLSLSLSVSVSLSVSLSLSPSIKLISDRKTVAPSLINVDLSQFRDLHTLVVSSVLRRVVSLFSPQSLLLFLISLLLSLTLSLSLSCTHSWRGFVLTLSRVCSGYGTSYKSWKSSVPMSPLWMWVLYLKYKRICHHFFDS